MKKVKLLLFLIILSPVFQYCATGAKQPNSNRVEFSLYYEFKVTGKTSKIKFIMVIPKTIPGKQRIALKYSHEPARVFEENGIRYAEFIFPNPQKSFTLEIKGKATLYRYDLSRARQLDKRKLSKGPNFEDFLKHEKHFEKDDPLIAAVARKFTGKSDVYVVRRIYDFVISHMEYASYGEVTIGAVEALKQKKGDCTEYSDLFVTLCRAKGIPARTVSGYTVRYDDKTPKHNWAEVYLKEYGWVPFEPTWADEQNSNAHTEAFDQMKAKYIYFSNIRNDKLIGKHSYSAWWWEGDKIEVERRIEFKRSR